MRKKLTDACDRSGNRGWLSQPRRVSKECEKNAPRFARAKALHARGIRARSPRHVTSHSFGSGLVAGIPHQAYASLKSGHALDNTAQCLAPAAFRPLRDRMPLPLRRFV